MASANNKRRANDEPTMEQADKELIQKSSNKMSITSEAQPLIHDIINEQTGATPPPTPVAPAQAETTEEAEERTEENDIAIQELIRQERETIESVPIIQTSQDISDDQDNNNVRHTLQPLDLPEVGQSITEEQDAALAVAIERLMSGEERSLTDAGQQPEVSYFQAGAFVSWNAADPFIRGISDTLVRVGVVSYQQDNNTVEKQLILDFDNSDLFFTEPVTIETFSNDQEEESEETNDQPQPDSV
jgi:hypothetical protein